MKGKKDREGKLERHRRRRLLVEAQKLNPKEERAFAEGLQENLAEGYRAMAEETRDAAERRLPAFREILKLRDLRRAARLQLLQVLERQPGALSQAEADRIATEAKHRTRELSFSRRAERRARFERPCSTSATRTSVESETP